jgi:hypothetical protein
VKTLGALFPPEERHLLICCDSLDFEAYASWDDDEGSDDDEFGSCMDDLHLGGEDFGDEEDMNVGELKCLQIDLRRFGLGQSHFILFFWYGMLIATGLDKYGLVNKFSRVLGDNGVNHMYSSTFKTANILVRYCSLLISPAPRY